MFSIFLIFASNCPKTGRMELSPGKYACVHDEYTPFHFLDGFQDGDDVFPSYAYYKSENVNKAVVITDGTIEISSSSSGKCNITVVFKTEMPDSKKEAQYKVIFDGEVAYYDGRESGDEDVPKNVEMKTFSRDRSGKTTTTRPFPSTTGFSTSMEKMPT